MKRTHDRTTDADKLLDLDGFSRELTKARRQPASDDHRPYHDERLMNEPDTPDVAPAAPTPAPTPKRSHRRHDTDADVINALAHFALRGDGYFKLGGREDHKCIYTSWKWTRGRWKGYYVPFPEWSLDFRAGVLGLLEKVKAVDEGRATPTPDKYGGPEGGA